MDEYLSQSLSSDLATKCLSARIKQIVHRSKELAAFFKRRSLAEEELGKSVQRAAQALQESFIREESSQQSFASSCMECSEFQHAEANHSIFFARSCLELADETLEWSRELEKTRKTLKDSATRSDRVLFEAETSRDKAKVKYDSLAEEWDRAQGVDYGKKSSFPFKTSRNSLTTKQIEEMKHRLDIAHVDWRTKVDTAQQLRREMVQKLRPAYVARFLETITESDANIVLQLHRFARMTEDLNLGRASVILPIAEQRISLHGIFAKISPRLDLNDYVANFMGGDGQPVAAEVPDPSMTSDVSRSMTGQVSIHNAEKTLDSVLKHDQAPVPNLVVTCCEAIEKWGLDVEGIYRLSAPTSAMDALRHTLLAGDMNTFSDKSMDVHAMACIVKQFFRELPDHLIPRDHQQIFLTATKLEDEHERRIAVHQAVNDLPDANYSTLRYLIFHLRKIELHAAKNLMTASNLAIIFGPTLVGSSNIQDMSYATVLIESLLRNCHLLFDENEL